MGRDILCQRCCEPSRIWRPMSAKGTNWTMPNFVPSTMLKSIATSMLSVPRQQLRSHGFLMDDGWSSPWDLSLISVPICKKRYLLCQNERRNVGESFSWGQSREAWLFSPVSSIDQFSESLSDGVSERRLSEGSTSGWKAKMPR